VADIQKVFLEPLHDVEFGLSYILRLAFLASDGIYQIVESACKPLGNYVGLTS
jgi:hypothetical protein